MMTRKILSYDGKPVLLVLDYFIGNHFYFRWATVTANKRSCSLANRQPDYVIIILTDNSFASSLGHSEVKSHAESDNHYHTNMDLLRLGYFCKDSIDEYKLLASIGIHMVGKS